MDVSIHIDSAEPVYEQIVRQIQHGVRNGVLAAGTPLPSVRQLAADLGLNRNTVARAYKMLEERGVIRTAGRKGTFVGGAAAEAVARLIANRAERVLRQAIDGLIEEGLRRDEIAAIFARALEAEHSAAVPAMLEEHAEALQ